jgi:hypothetical protein
MELIKKDRLFQSCSSLYSRDKKQWATLGLIFFCIVAAQRFWSSDGSKPSMADSSFIKSNTAALDPADNWIIHLHGSSYARSTYSKSQGSQDYYLETIFAHIGETNRYFVEFGFNEPSYTSGGSGANTWDLHDKGWRGLLLDAENENPAINLRKHFLYSDNIASIFKSYLVPKEPDYLSCDMDSHDLFVWKAILESGYRPRVMSTEFNSNYPLNLTITEIDPCLKGRNDAMSEFRFKQCAWGASAGALKLIADKYGYVLVGRVGLLDLFWVRKDLLPNSWVIPDFSWFFDNKLGKLHHEAQASADTFNYLMDFAEYARSGNLQAAMASAKSTIESSNLECFNNIV